MTRRTLILRNGLAAMAGSGCNDGPVPRDPAGPPSLKANFRCPSPLRVGMYRPRVRLRTPGRDLFKHRTFGLDADGNNCERSDEIRKREGVQDVISDAAREHCADHGRREERADATDAEEPACCGGAEVRRMQFADIDSCRTINAGIDPADQRDRDVHPEAGGHCKPEMECGADKEIEEKDRPPAE